jgi:hypothetical protein
MHSAFEQFAAFHQDAIDNRAFVAKGKLNMPVLAIGGEKSFGRQHSLRCKSRDRSRHPGFGTLADGRAACRYCRGGACLP